jgi:hypothetical protein
MSPTINNRLSGTTSVSSSGSLFARQFPNDDTETTDDNNKSHYQTYYFVFFALLFCIALLCVYFVWKKRRNALTVRNGFSGAGYQRDVQEWDTVRYRRRYWNTNSRNAEASREEGLNEHGEAPPPYVPKDDENTGRILWTGTSETSRAGHPKADSIERPGGFEATGLRAKRTAKWFALDAVMQCRPSATQRKTAHAFSHYFHLGIWAFSRSNKGSGIRFTAHSWMQSITLIRFMIPNFHSDST